MQKHEAIFLFYQNPGIMQWGWIIARGGHLDMPEWLATPKMWSDIFALGAPVVEKMLRPVAGVCFSGGGAAGLRQTRTGATESLRPGGAALAVQHGAERDHRQRQFADRRTDRRAGAAGDELPGGAIPVPASPAGPDLRRQADDADRARQGDEEGAGEGTADARRS